MDGVYDPAQYHTCVSATEELPSEEEAVRQLYDLTEMATCAYRSADRGGFKTTPMWKLEYSLGQLGCNMSSWVEMQERYEYLRTALGPMATGGSSPTSFG